MPRTRYVWVGIHRPAPDHPPRHPRVEHVFADEQSAKAWRDDFNLQYLGRTQAHREVQKFEVERAAPNTSNQRPSERSRKEPS